MELAWLACTTTVAIAFQVGWLTKRNSNKPQDRDALDGVLGGARNTLLCPRCAPGLIEILDFPARF